jgi:hypothetical protein
MNESWNGRKKGAQITLPLGWAFSIVYISSALMIFDEVPLSCVVRVGIELCSESVVVYKCTCKLFVPLPSLLTRFDLLSQRSIYFFWIYINFPHKNTCNNLFLFVFILAAASNLHQTIKVNWFFKHLHAAK